MFFCCDLLISLPDIFKRNTNNINCIIGMFKKCNSSISLPDISK